MTPFPEIPLMLAILVGLSICPKSEHHAPKVRHLVPTSIDSVVRIATDCNFCTGFVVKKNVIVTAAHCFEHSTNFIHAEFVDGTVSRLYLVKKGDETLHPDADVAVLIGDTRGVAPLPLAKPNGISKCISVGYATGAQQATACYGAVADSTGLDRYAGEVDFGDSGGPVFNEQGEVIGEQVSIDGYWRPIFYAVPASIISQFIKDAKL